MELLVGLLLWLISLVPRAVIRVGLIFLVGFSCGHMMAYRVRGSTKANTTKVTPAKATAARRAPVVAKVPSVKEERPRGNPPGTAPYGPAVFTAPYAVREAR